jgi:catechol 2,3-dioxygenase-like lactoylglutathione lyase family enzyme
VRDLEASKRFYAAGLEALGQALSGEGDGYFSSDELFASDDGEPTVGLHLAFQARNRETVDALHKRLEESGSDGPSTRERHRIEIRR